MLQFLCYKFLCFKQLKFFVPVFWNSIIFHFSSYLIPTFFSYFYVLNFFPELVPKIYIRSSSWGLVQPGPRAHPTTHHRAVRQRGVTPSRTPTNRADRDEMLRRSPVAPATVQVGEPAGPVWTGHDSWHKPNFHNQRWLFDKSSVRFKW